MWTGRKTCYISGNASQSFENNVNVTDWFTLVLFLGMSNEVKSIKDETQCFIPYQTYTDKRAKNTTRSGVFLTNFEVFDKEEN